MVMKMVNLLCKKDLIIEKFSPSDPDEIAFKKGKRYVFLKVDDIYHGFNEEGFSKHTLTEDFVEEYFYTSPIGEFVVCRI